MSGTADSSKYISLNTVSQRVKNINLSSVFILVGTELGRFISMWNNFTLQKGNSEVLWHS